MPDFSVVIVCKNEADQIAVTLKSLTGVTDDIVVYDNGSTDGTQNLVKQFGVNLYEGEWEGFAKTKTKANNLAKYAWILSLDADEAIDEELKQSLLQWQPGNDKVVYDIRFKNFIGKRVINYGEWGKDHHIRFFNRHTVYWGEAAVHENLILPEGTEKKQLKGFVLHYTTKNIDEYSDKMFRYAMLNAEKYFLQGKKASFYKLYISPGLTFLNNFIVNRGFMDGFYGFFCARMTAYYSFLKYARLKELWVNK